MLRVYTGLTFRFVVLKIVLSFAWLSPRETPHYDAWSLAFYYTYFVLVSYLFRT